MSVLETYGLAVAVAATFGAVASVGFAFVVMMGLQYQDFMAKKRLEEAKAEAQKLSSDLRDEILSMQASGGVGSILGSVSGKAH